MEYEYTDGNLTTLTTPSGQTVVYGYADGRITSIAVNGTTLLSGVTYEPLGPVNGWTWGNSTTMSRTFDTDGNVTAIASSFSKTFDYDDAFRITDITDTVTSANSYAYDYDDLDRLTSAVKTGTTRGWTYDDNGNRLSETGASASTYTIASTSNRVTSISGAISRTNGYDDAGNTLTYSGFTATYNNRSRMATVNNGTATASFTYNALGELVKRAGGAPGTVHYVYDEAGHLLGEYDATGALIEETVWLGDTPVATLRPGTPVGVFYVHTDHLNTPRKVTRPSDNQARWTWESDPFGTALPNENPQSLGTFQYNLRFPGQIYDAHTGLNYNYFRDYDAVTGRYIQSDPIGLGGGLNTYGYVAGNPTNRLDPYGLSAADVEFIRQHVAENLPDIRVNPKWGFDTLLDKRGAYASTDLISGTLWVDVKYQERCLTLDAFRELYSNVIHESMHNTDGVFGRMQANKQDRDASEQARRAGRRPEGALGPKHQSIFNREDWEMQRYLSPVWPMWGIPTVDALTRPPISPLVDALYENTRTEQCGCN